MLAVRYTSASRPLPITAAMASTRPKPLIREISVHTVTVKVSRRKPA